MNKRSKGRCTYCGKEYTKSAMIKHLLSCIQRKATWLSGSSNEKKAGYFSLVIAGTYRKNYWLAIDVREDATLKDIDGFLRDIWLECCGHLSAFQINGVSYDNELNADGGWGIPSKNMREKLETVLEEGMALEYEYDFGSTTELTINVIEARIGVYRKNKIEIMARNKPVEELCDACGERVATAICSVCVDDGTGMLCDVCKQDHDCGEEMFLSIVNSPRCGVCAYEGSSKYPND